MGLKILVAEDEDITLKHLTYTLEQEGHSVTGTGNGIDALAKIEKENFDLLIADIKMPGKDGLTLLTEVREKSPDTAVIIITGFGSIESAVNAMRMGAFDYVTKPFNLDELGLKIKKIENIKRLEKENIAFKISLGLGRGTPIIAKSKMMKKVIDIINSIA
ncbi:MAG: response regulator, partial [Nitrospirota bacterium]|nr:response regulator [Nitrospirota bacterium]